jgi:putative tricarboxylic transport membrane protein
MRHPDILSGLAAIAGGAALIYVSLDIDVAPGETTLNARFMPILAAACIVACGIAIAAKGLLAEPTRLPFGVNPRVTAILVLFLAYFLTFEYVDFRFGAWALTLACMYVLGGRKPVQLVLTPVLTAAVVYLMFRYGFEVILPTWI